MNKLILNLTILVLLCNSLHVQSSIRENFVTSGIVQTGTDPISFKREDNELLDQQSAVEDEYDPADVAALKVIRGNMPVGSSLKTAWIDDSKVGSWIGIHWTDLPPRKVKYLEVSNQGLSVLDISSFTALEMLLCSDNKLTVLNATGLKMLSDIYCPNNLLRSVDITGSDKVYRLNCSSNMIPFSQLPVRLPVSGGYYAYFSQSPFQENITPSIGSTLDYSSEAMIDGVATRFKWVRSNLQIVGTDQSGKYTIMEEGYYYCELTNTKFPNLTLTTKIYKIGNPPDYDPNDLNALRAIRDNAPSDSPLKLEWADESRIVSWVGTSWSLNPTKRLIYLDLRDKRLTSLDVSHLPALETISCSTNKLTSINITGLTVLKYLACNNNKIPLSQLPLKLPVTGGTYTYFPQETLYEKTSVTAGELLDYSSEALIDGKPTVFTWYKDNAEIKNTDQTGKYSPTSEGYYYCKMVNTKFPQLVQTTTLLKLGNPPLYDPVDVAGLKAIRDNAPLDSPLKIKWANEANIGTWEGVFWTSLPSKKITKLMIWYNKLTIIDLSPFSLLETVYCSNNNLVVLKCEGLTKLKELYCFENKLSFANLPLVSSMVNVQYGYGSQNKLYEERAINTGETIDYSFESLMNGKGTVFTWYKDNVKIDGTDQTGKYTPVTDGYYYCVMTNVQFPQSTLTSNAVKAGIVAEFDPRDVEALKSIRDKAPADSPLKVEWADESKIGSWSGVKWSDLKARRVVELSLYNKKLVELDVTSFSELTSLTCSQNKLIVLNMKGLVKLNSMYCDGNQLTDLDLTGLTILNHVVCTYNKIPFSKLPIRLPASGGYYGYDPQNLLYEERKIAMGETIDYSSEAMIGTKATTFSWFKNGEKITGTDQTGKYTPTTDGYYTCKMVNANFPVSYYSLELTTNRVTLGIVMEYDPVDVAALKAIRDNAPVGSKPKIYWADDSKIKTWDGVYWSEFAPRKVIELGLSYGILTSLDISALSSLKKFSCFSNNIKSLKISETAMLEYLSCDGNQLTFSSLPINPTVSSSGYSYANQRQMDLERSINSGETIDYSAEAVIGGVSTVYKWYRNNVLINDADQSGKYTPLEEGYYYCKMTNSQFPLMVLSSASIKVGTPSEYDPREVAALKAIRDNAPADSPLKLAWSDETKIATWAGVTWSSVKPYQVQSLYVNNKKLIALDVSAFKILSVLNCSYNLITTLDLRGLDVLQHIECNDNLITSLNIGGLTRINTLYCYNNKLTFSNIPRSITGVQYNVNTQKLFEERTIAEGETIDYSSEAAFEGVPSVFVWTKNEVKIEGTDQTGKYTPTGAGVYSCTITNAKFNYVALITSPVMVGSVEQYSSQDLMVLKAIRDNAPSESPLKTLWGDDSKMASWAGVTWSTYLPRRVIYLLVEAKKLVTLDVKQLSALIHLSCVNNSLTVLDIAGLTNLKYIYCSNNQLTAIDQATGTKASYLDCRSNYIPLSKLPYPRKVLFPESYEYLYSPQNRIDNERTIVAGETIDYSSEAMIDGNKTTFTWYRGDVKITEADQSGKYTPTEDGYYSCTMFNVKFPDLTITTNKVKLGNPDEYSVQDMAALIVLRDLAPLNSPLKTLWGDETKKGTWSGVGWTNNVTRRVTSLDLSYRELISLEVNKLTALQFLYCTNNKLSSIDLTGTNLNSFNCSYNKLPFSKLPLALPGTGIYKSYLYSPQGLIFEEKKILLGETIDYSSEALIDGVSTVFTWYKNSIKIVNTDQSGRYTPLEEGYYHCMMTNTKFANLSLTTNEITVGNPPEFDLQDVLALKAIRDNAPESSRLKTYWADETKIGTWSGVTWNETRSKKVKTLSVGWNELTVLDVSKLTCLEVLDCRNNKLQTLNLLPLSKLRECYCENNFLSFSNLLLKFPITISYLTISPQGLLFEPRTIAPGETIDYSAEVLFDGVSTIFTWYKDNVKIENVNQTGTYVPIFEGYYYCTLTNTKFPRLTLTTNVVKVGNPPEYDAQDIAALKTIRNNSPLNSSLRTLWKDDNTVTTWQGVIWGTSPPKRIKELRLSSCSLISVNFPSLNAIERLDCSFNYLTSIDFSTMPNLQTISCSDNQLTSINITGLTHLSTLYCNNNQLLFSKLPLKLPALDGIYNYNGQFYPSNQQPNTIGSTIDYSSEAVINGVSTRYRWYRNGILIAGTDNSGNYTISEDGYYYCILSNSMFSSLSIPTGQIKVGTPIEYDSQDIITLKSIRDNAFSDSPIKTYWADDTKISTWVGVTWSTTIPRKVKQLSLSDRRLGVLDVRPLAGLEQLYCSSNQLASLNVSGMTNLQVLNCQNNLLTSIDISTLTKLNNFNCAQNKITLSQLPLQLPLSNAYYTYAPQNPFGEVHTMAIGETIDYASEAVIAGVATSFVWYKNDVKIEGTDNSGKLTPSTEGFYHCSMSNSKLYNLTVTTAKTRVGNPIEFDPQDIEALKAIRDNAPSDSQLKSLWFDDNKIGTWSGVSWNTIFPKKVRELYVSSSRLISLDVTKLTALETLYCTYNQLKNLKIDGLPNLSTISCYGNQLEAIELTGTPKVRNLYCDNNKISFSKLPIRLPVSGGSYKFSPQSRIYEDRTISAGEMIDYSSEAVVEGTNTSFTWFKNNTPIDNVDQSGKFIPTEDGHYYCQMINSKFPGLTLLTNDLKLGTPPDYDPKNVAALKAIRDLAPVSSPLKTQWDDLKPLETWAGVIWSSTYPKIVISLSVNSMQLATLDLKELTGLKLLYCSQNNLTSLNLSGLSSLGSIYCSENQLVSIDLTGISKLNYIYIYNNNFSFSKLPVFSYSLTYSYSPQKVLYEEKTIALGETIDYSSESTIQGQPTFFTWYKNDVKIVGTDQTGKYTPTSYGSYHCTMTNNYFYNLTLTTHKIKAGTIPEFDAVDVSVLKSIHDNAPIGSLLKTDWADESQIGTWAGVEWNNSIPKKIIRLTLSDKKMTSLNVTQLTELVGLVCSQNQLTTLNLIGLLKLSSLDCSFNQLSSISLPTASSIKELDCSNNKIPFSKLPLRLPVLGSKFQYSPMNLIFEDKSLVLGEPINYMVEALIDGNSTVFTWYRNDVLILSTDQSGKYVPLTEGIYHCTMTNAKFPGLTLTTSPVKIYQLPEFDSQDVEALKSLRNNSPADSPLRTQWADDSKFSSWEGVTWSDYPIKKVKVLQLSQRGLKNLDVSSFLGLEQLYCNNNQLTSLKMNGLNNLNYVSCTNNLLRSIDLSGLPKIQNLFCNNNKFTFSKLPLKLSVSGGNYQFWPQQLIYEEQTIAMGGTIDFSSEALIDGKATIFNWYKNNILIPGTDQSGKFQTSGDGYYHCTMTNARFPGLTLTTNKITTGILYEFDPGDVAVLKSIRDNSPVNAYIRTNWKDDTQMGTWQGVKWSLFSPKKVTNLDVSDNFLTTLDVTGLTSMATLSCRNNQLTTLDIHGLANLKSVDAYSNRITSVDWTGLVQLNHLICTANNIPFSRLFLQLPSWDISSYDYYPQNLLFHEYTINLGETIDYSSEAIIDNVATTFTWYRNSIKIEGTDQTGKYIPTLPGYYHCTMTNARFPRLIQSTYSVQLGSSIEFDAQDIAALKKIRDDAPAQSPLKTVWAEETNPSSWQGVTWSEFYPKRVLKLNLISMNLSSLNISPLTALEELYCVNNELSSLNLAGLLALKTVNCDMNQLTSIDVTGLPQLHYLTCAKNNIPFSQLLPNLPYLSGSWAYAPQNQLFQEKTINLGETIDFSSEAIIEHVATAFIWNLNSVKIDGTDQTGKYIPTSEGYYHCTMTNTKFPDLTEMTYSVKVGSSVEFNPNDVAALKTIRDNSPDDSPLKTEWADESVMGIWTGVTWSETYPKRVKMLNLMLKNLSSLDVTKLNSLVKLSCQNNHLTELIVNGLTQLQYIDCTYNQLSFIDISNLPSLSQLGCFNNQFSFSQLPLLGSETLYEYNPQEILYKERIIELGETIDYSNEAMINGVSTVFTWYRNNEMIAGTDQSGKYSPTSDGDYYCKMSNSSFPYLTLSTSKVNIQSLIQFDPAEIDALNTIRDNAPEDSPLRTEWADPTLVGDWTGITWTESSPKKVQELELSSNGLTVLDVTPFPVLEKLDCSDNQLLSLQVNDLTSLQQLDVQNNELLLIDLSGVSNLEVLNCSNNKFLFSSLPSSQIVSNDNYWFFGQKAQFEEKTINLGETIDFSSEAVIDGVATVFNWYMDSIKIDQADQSGIYTPPTNGKYYCTMTNDKFPGLIISTNTIKVNSPDVIAEDINRMLPLSIFPNPTDGNIFIEFPIIPQRETRLSVIDITGKIILKQNSLLQNEQINLSGLPAGIYFVMINNSTFSKSYKIKLN